ncbi:methyltransferase domain-containing protein [Streptomyces sp. NPDC050560]|uniref:methyltransferase domain-containing protein n=1 Tax=Streptomyces sp. NPDC050560 TaxID=3365630 RepID=UPI0037AE15F4
MRTRAVDEAAARERAAMVRTLAEDGAFDDDPAWRPAFEAVPRHLFVPYYYTGVMGGHRRLWGEDPDPGRRAEWLRGAYTDAPLATRLRDGELVSSSSQPSLMARMLAWLQAADGHRVLEIGAGTGYNAALLAYRLGEERVTTVDLEPEITEGARAHLDAAGLHPAVVTGDGARGCPRDAPYDRIIATCALDDVPRPWLAQCRPGARVLTPFGTGLLALRVAGAARAEGRFLATPAYFVPLRGGPRRAAPRDGGVRLPGRALRSDGFRFLLALASAAADPGDLYRVWEEQGRPERERYGISVDGTRAWAWLDAPEGPHTWPL